MDDDICRRAYRARVRLDLRRWGGKWPMSPGNEVYLSDEEHARITADEPDALEATGERDGNC